ncbi:Similar to Probable Rho-GTPase-activating protein 6; acc. no. O43027 [Pyronema omphalodes CBS 100304]|uniref:Similar to Probable Rho-GTPase-activating protein 6 acc. no. O43027 n=1 Tax=Pyronema omphalodes (strain CBS 100304) TaxID=1076935 RepID=U4L8D3_PYROM|nr:Similar to Probable Rho-GTPase-activating protein 6; acc. no. O43027 [Pyronema omphalodes CBS 100304]
MAQAPRARTSRRSRPSLAALTDSGYEPSSTVGYGKNMLPHSLSRNTSSPNFIQMADREKDLRKHLLADMFTDGDERVHNPSATLRSLRALSSFDVDGEAAGDSSGTITGRSGSSVHPKSSTISRSATISSAWSGVSNRLFMESVLGTGNEQRQTNDFTEQFDRLAKKHGIQPFPVDYKAEPTSVSVSSASREQSSGESTPTMGGNRFWNKLLGRTPSTVDVSKQHGNMKLTLTKRRHPNISDLAAIGRGKRDSLKGMHLEDMIRLGGVAIFNLPLGLAPGDLLIPTCIHAAAQFLLNNGLKTPGIFRVSGNVSTVYALYDFYQKQLEENNNEAVVATTALARLPSHIHYSIHDVAHLFRKLLHGLPGGLLGSPSVFQALYNIHRFVYPDPSLGDEMTRKVKPRMIALAISSVNLHFRISLICAVFGLLRAITLANEQELETKVKDPHEMFASIKEDALGIVFGPLLLGDKSDHILTDDLEDRGGLLVLPSVDPTATATKRNKSTKSRSSKLDMSFNKKNLEKTRRAAMVCQMLIDNWEDIVYQMKKIDTLATTAQAYDLPAQTGGEFKYVSESSKKGTMRDDIGRTSTLKSQKGSYRSGTVRSARHTPAPVPEPVKHKYHSIAGHHIPMPNLGHNFHSLHASDLPDLMRFSARNSHEQEPEEQLPVPLVAEKRDMEPMTPITEMTPITQMTPIRTLPHPDIPEPEASPNWRVITPEQMTEPSTPTRNTFNITTKQPVLERIPYDQETSQSSSHSRNSSRSSRNRSPVFDPTASPPISIMAQPAIRPGPRRELAPAFEESPNFRVQSNASMLSEAPSEQSSRRGISPIPEFERPSAPEPPEDPEDPDDRPITPRPLSFKKKTPSPNFSIYEDNSPAPSSRQSSRSPRLTLTKPNSRSPITLNPGSGSRGPSPNTLPLLPATTSTNRRRAATIESDFEDRFVFDPEGKKNNSALYAEIRRLQRMVDTKNEEAIQTRKELELARNMANAGTLSQLVRECQEEVKIWRNRAEWAEKMLRERGIGMEGIPAAPGQQQQVPQSLQAGFAGSSRGPPPAARRGAAHRYSVS